MQPLKTCPPCHGDCNQGRTCPARRHAGLGIGGTPAGRPAAPIVRALLRGAAIATALMFVLGMYVLGAAIDAEPDAREETANLLALQDAQAAAAQEQRRQTAAYKACMSDHGPNVAAAWNFEGQLICQPKRGPERIVTAHSAIK